VIAIPVCRYHRAMTDRPSARAGTLATALMARLDDTHRAAQADAAAAAGDLESALRGAVERAHTAWPALPLGDEDFVGHLAAHLPAELSPADGVASCNAPDLYLACSCAHRVPGAAAAFQARYLDHLGALLHSLAPEPALVEEVRQVVGEKLLVGGAGVPPHIGAYSGRGSLLNWVRVVATRAALDLLRAAAARAGDRHDSQAVDEAVARDARDPELDFIKGRYRDEFKRAIQEALAALPAEQRNLLKLHLLDGLSIDELGRLFRLHRATAARRLVAARAAVLDGTRALLRERLRLSPSEFDSLAEEVRSQIDLSLSGILGEA
jgi:RNA polymerase sigma-70 factor (ECF subfamily)